MEKQLNLIIGLISVALVLIVAILFIKTAMPANASVIAGNEYQHFNIAAATTYGATTTLGVIKTGQGSLAQLVLMGPTLGILNFYDATTTDVTKRTGNLATSTILITSLGTGMSPATYTFDTTFTTGLLVESIGATPTTTILYR